jgi:hypothetical protein
MKRVNYRLLLGIVILLLGTVAFGCISSSDNQTRAVPYDQSYIGSKVSLEYHAASCAVGQNIPLPDRIQFKTTAEAEAAGYRPCSTCLPVK